MSPLECFTQIYERGKRCVTPGDLAEEIVRFPNSLAVADNVKNLGRRIAASHSQDQNKINR